MRSTRLRSSRSALFPIVLLIAAVLFWPVVDSMQRQSTSAQSVSWLGPDSTSYLTSSGIPVMVPSWLPGPVAGSSPEIYAGGGSYSIYFYGAGNTFLYITGVAGAGFPGGSEANLNVELTVNASVQGYPAIHDLGIPEGSDTPIYDKVMWIAGGVLYTVSGNGLDSDSLSLANSSVVLQAPAPVPTDPPVVEEPPTSAPVTEPPSESPGTSGQNQTGEAPSTDTIDTGSTQSQSQTESQPQSQTSGDATTGPFITGAESGDGTSGAFYESDEEPEVPSDGTTGPPAPRIRPDDGTGGPP